MDGEIAYDEKLTIEVYPKAIKFVIPHNITWLKNKNNLLLCISNIEEDYNVWKSKGNYYKRIRCWGK